MAARAWTESPHLDYRPCDMALSIRSSPSTLVIGIGVAIVLVAAAHPAVAARPNGAADMATSTEPEAQATEKPEATKPPAPRPEGTTPEAAKPGATKPGATEPGAGDRPAGGAPSTAQPPSPAQARVEDFLLELERTGSTISTLSGALAYEKFDALVEESERRYGRLVLDSKDGRRRFAIHFDEFIDGTGRSDRSVDHWIYADGWLSEQDHRNRSFTRRQIVPPGRDFDPLALGEGPIPIPIGQKRADVLARFEASETDVPQDVPLLATLRNVAGLRLVPKAGTDMARSTEAVELFFDRTTLAPTGVVVREKNGNRTIARISSPVVNGEVRPEDRALLEVPSPDPGAWTIDVRPWKE